MCSKDYKGQRNKTKKQQNHGRSLSPKGAKENKDTSSTGGSVVPVPELFCCFLLLTFDQRGAPFE